VFSSWCPASHLEETIDILLRNASTFVRERASFFTLNCLLIDVKMAKRTKHLPDVLPELFSFPFGKCL